MTLIDALRQAIQVAGLSQQLVATQYHIPLRTLESWLGGSRKPPDYVVNLLLRCLAMDYPNKVLSEQEPTLIFCDSLGKPLPDRLAELVRKEYEAGRVQLIGEIEADLHDELSYTTSKHSKGKLYQCTEIDIDSEIPFGFDFRVKEV